MYRNLHLSSHLHNQPPRWRRRSWLSMHVRHHDQSSAYIPREGRQRQLEGYSSLPYCACSQSNRSALAYNRQTVKTVAMCMRAIYNIYNKYNQLICPLVSTGNLPTGCPLVICRTGLYFPGQSGIKSMKVIYGSLQLFMAPGQLQEEPPSADGQREQRPCR